MMKGRINLKEEEIRYVMSEMLMGVAYLHSQKKIHRVVFVASLHSRTSNRVIFC